MRLTNPMFRTCLLSLFFVPTVSVVADDAQPTEPKPTANNPADRNATVLTEDFNEKFTLDWDIVRPDDTHYSLETVPGALALTTQFGSIHGQTSDGEFARNIMLVNRPIEPRQNFEATLEVSQFQPDLYYQQVALLVYQGDDDYAKWSMERSWDKQGVDNLVLVLERNQVPQHSFVNRKTIDGPFWLRIKRERTKYSVFYSDDGDAFEKLGETVWVPGKDKQPVRVGFLAKNGGNRNAKDIEVLLESFKLKLE